MRTHKQLIAAFGLTLLSTVLSCAQGSPADPVTKIDAPVIVEPPLCGNTKLDPGEECECPNKETKGQCKVDNMTCAMLRPGSLGTLLCNAAPMCTFNFSLCTGGAPGATGAGGTGR
jgi:hypothetical protein